MSLSNLFPVSDIGIQT